MYKLSAYFLEENGHNTDNVFNEAKSINLTYISYPKLSLDSDFKASYNSDNVINSKKINATSLSSFEIYGQIGDSKADQTWWDTAIPLL